MPDYPDFSVNLAGKCQKSTIFRLFFLCQFFQDTTNLIGISKLRIAYLFIVGIIYYTYYEEMVE